MIFSDQIVCAGFGRSDPPGAPLTWIKDISARWRKLAAEVSDAA
jgi:hypothetical protein